MKYAVVRYYSFDPQCDCWMFNTWEAAVNFLKKSIKEEYRIDADENEWDVEMEIQEDDGYAKLTDHFRTGDEYTEYRIAEVREEVEIND